MEITHINVPVPGQFSVGPFTADGSEAKVPVEVVFETKPIFYGFLLNRYDNYQKEESTFVLTARIMSTATTFEFLTHSCALTKEFMAQTDFRKSLTHVFWNYLLHTDEAQNMCEAQVKTSKAQFENFMETVNIDSSNSLANGGLIKDGQLYSVSFVADGMWQQVGDESVSRESKQLPNIMTPVQSPCACPAWTANDRLWNVIQHLNDKHTEWTREKIADWLDELHDSGKINIEFQPWEDDKPKTNIDVDWEKAAQEFKSLAEAAKETSNALASFGDGWEEVGHTTDDGAVFIKPIGDENEQD